MFCPLAKFKMVSKIKSQENSCIIDLYFLNSKNVFHSIKVKLTTQKTYSTQYYLCLRVLIMDIYMQLLKDSVMCRRIIF